MATSTARADITIDHYNERMVPDQLASAQQVGDHFVWSGLSGDDHATLQSFSGTRTKMSSLSRFMR